MLRLYVYTARDCKAVEIWEYQTDKLNNHIWQTAIKLVKEYTSYSDSNTTIFITIDANVVGKIRTVYNPELGKRVMVIVRETDGKTIVL